jgi:hypothetical protein
VRSWVDPADPAFHSVAAAQFAHTPVSAEYWQYPGCSLKVDVFDFKRVGCTVYWAYRDLSGSP